MSWRDKCRPIIAAVIERFGEDESALKRELLAAYPFGERANHPYTIWLDEIKRQLGTKKMKTGEVKIVPLPGQKELF